MKKLFTKHFKKVSLIGIIVFGLLFLSNCKKDLPEQKKLENNLITPDISEQTTKLSKQDELLLDSIYESYEYSKIAEIANKTQAFIAKMQEYSIT
ncbi:MAG: hypothetical protein IE931_14080 [Sphingobacteriales bacterium]|nr:hypothetical protein [Sphingobacteriales bacterium]